MVRRRGSDCSLFCRLVAGFLACMSVATAGSYAEELCSYLLSHAFARLTYAASENPIALQRLRMRGLGAFIDNTVRLQATTAPVQRSLHLLAVRTAEYMITNLMAGVPCFPPRLFVFHARCYFFFSCRLGRRSAQTISPTPHRWLRCASVLRIRRVLWRAVRRVIAPY